MNNLSIIHKQHESNINHTTHDRQDEYKSEDDDDDDNLPPDLQCNICFRIFTNPVKNTMGNTYCYKCITDWYSRSIKLLVEEKNEENIRDIQDPKTNCPLPQNCLLLIPDFEKLVNIYQYKQGTEIGEDDKKKLLKFDEYLNKYRQYLVKRPLERSFHDDMINIGCEGDGLFTKQNLKQVVDEIWRLFDLQDRIDQIIKIGVGFWNQTYGHSLHFEFISPKFEFIPTKRDKNIANDMMQQYGIDDAFDVYSLEIDQFVADIVEIMAKNASKQVCITVIKDKIMERILVK